MAVKRKSKSKKRVVPKRRKKRYVRSAKMRSRISRGSGTPPGGH